jgi:hypothetical protein
VELLIVFLSPEWCDAEVQWQLSTKLLHKYLPTQLRRWQKCLVDNFPRQHSWKLICCKLTKSAPAERLYDSFFAIRLDLFCSLFSTYTMVTAVFCFILIPMHLVAWLNFVFKCKATIDTSKSIEYIAVHKHLKSIVSRALIKVYYCRHYWGTHFTCT